MPVVVVQVAADKLAELPVVLAAVVLAEMQTAAEPVAERQILVAAAAEAELEHQTQELVVVLVL
jgi:hypothetical protein